MKTIAEMLDAVFAAEAIAWAKWDEANAAFGTEQEGIAAKSYADACAAFNSAKADLRWSARYLQWRFTVSP